MPLRHGLVIVLLARVVLVEVENATASYTDWMTVLPVTTVLLTIPVSCPSPPLPMCRAGWPWK